MGWGRARAGAGLLALACALALPVRAAEPERVAVASFRGANTLMRRVAAELTAELGRELGQLPGVRPVGPLDLERLEQARQPVAWWAATDADRQRCGPDDAACLARLVPEGEADWLLVGNVSGGRQVHRVEVALVSLPGREVVWRGGQREGAPSALVDAVAGRVEQVLRARGYLPSTVESRPVFAPETPPEPVGEAPGPPPAAGWWLALAGGGVAVAGGAVFIPAAITWDQLHSATWRAANRPAAILDTTGTFNSLSTVGGVLLGVGGAAVAAGVLWALVPGWQTALPVALAPGPGGLVVGGRW